MARGIFISYQHKDRMQAKGFNLLHWNKNVDLRFQGRHLLDPVDSTNQDYIRSEISKQLKGTSVTVVLLGGKTHDSDWVKWEIEKSQGKTDPNGVLAIRLDKDAPLPANSKVGVALNDCGAEVIDWDPHQFNAAIERAARAAGRAKAILTGSLGGSSCGR